MENKCAFCNELIKYGERVEALVRTDFKPGKLTAYASLAQEDMELVPGVLAHVKCVDNEDYYSDDVYEGSAPNN